jgi:hypothetical protein
VARRSRMYSDVLEAVLPVRFPRASRIEKTGGKEGRWITFYYYVITLRTTAILSVTEVINVIESLNLTTKLSQ